MPGEVTVVATMKVKPEHEDRAVGILEGVSTPLTPRRGA